MKTIILAALVFSLAVSLTAEEFTLPNNSSEARASLFPKGAEEYPTEKVSCYVLAVYKTGVMVNPSKTIALNGNRWDARHIPWQVRDRSKIYFIVNIPEAFERRLVDGSHFYAVLRRSGRAKYIDIDGNPHTVKLYDFVKIDKKSDHKQP